MSGADLDVPLAKKAPAASSNRRRAAARWGVPAAAIVLLGLAMAGALRPGWTAASALVPAVRGTGILWCLAAALCQVLMYSCVAGILRSGLRASAVPEVPLISLTGASAAFLWANRALPGPAVAGLATLVFVLSRRGISGAVAQAAAAVFYAADYIAFAPLCISVLITLSALGRLAGLHSHVLVIALLLIAIGAACSITLLKSPRLLYRIVGRLAVTAAFLTRRSDRAEASRAVAESGIRRFYSRWDEITARPAPLACASAWSFLMHIAEIATIWCAMRAFSHGGAASPTALQEPRLFWKFWLGASAAYTAGNLAAIVSFLPAGLGFFEGAMVTALHLVSGLTIPQAVLATGLYRIFSVWLPLPFVLRTARHALANASAYAGGKLSDEGRH